MFLLGTIFGWFFIVALILGIISGIMCIMKFPVPKDLSEREREQYIKALPPFNTKMSLPQDLDTEKIKNELRGNNFDGIIYEEFKAFAKKRFVITENGLVYDGRVIPYDYISFVSMYLPATLVTCGVAQIVINGELKNLSYKFRDRKRAKLAFEYINTVANPNEPWPPSLAYWEMDLEKLEEKEWENSLQTEKDFNKSNNIE